MVVVALRPVQDGDLDAFFEQMRDPESVRMAAFTPPDPDDRNAFDAHMTRVRSSPGITMRAVTCDGRLAGSIASFPDGDQTEVTYWIDRPAWGRASRPRRWRCSWTRCPPGRCTPAPPATTPVPSASCKNAASGPSGPRSRSLRDATKTSRKPSCGWTPDGRTGTLVPAARRPVVAGWRSA